MDTSPLHRRLVIIGSGPAGLTAGIYAGRAQLTPYIFDGAQPGGQLMGTTTVENWPSRTSISGVQLMLDMREQAQTCGAQFHADSIVHVDLTMKPFQLTTSRGQLWTSDALIVATGATPKRLGCPGESLYWGRGVSTCAVCDGALYRNNKLIVVGGGDTALEAATFLATLGNQVTLIHRRTTFSASVPMQQRLVRSSHVQTILESTVTEIHGDGKRVSGATVTTLNGRNTLLPADGIFIAIGLSPNTQFLKGQLPTDSSGHLITSTTTHTTREGVFAAGDVVDSRYRQAITSAGEGCKAALDAERYLAHLI